MYFWRMLDRCFYVAPGSQTGGSDHMALLGGSDHKREGRITSPKTRCDPTLPFVVVRHTVVTGIYVNQDRYDQICGPFVVLVQ